MAREAGFFSRWVIARPRKIFQHTHGLPIKMNHLYTKPPVATFKKPYFLNLFLFSKKKGLIYLKALGLSRRALKPKAAAGFTKQREGFSNPHPGKEFLPWGRGIFSSHYSSVPFFFKKGAFVCSRWVLFFQKKRVFFFARPRSRIGRPRGSSRT